MFTKILIGFLLTPGFRPADVVGVDAVLGIYPKHKVFYVAENDTMIYGKSGFGIQANSTYKSCPQLDVLVVGEMSESELTNDSTLAFIKRQAPEAKYIIAISNGVLSLYNAEVLTDQKVTADKITLKKLQETTLTAIDTTTCLVDGKFVTAGPSTGGIEAAYTVFNELRSKWLTRFLEFNLEYNAHIQYPNKDNKELKQPPLPKPINVGIFLPNGAYVPDIMGATDVFGCIPNAKIYLINENKEISESLGGLGVTTATNTTFDNCPQLDVMIFGASHPKYVKDNTVLDFVIEQEKNAKAVITVCAGTFIVGSAGLLEGKEATTNYHQIKDLGRVGACYTGKEVEVDGKFLSAGPAVGSYEAGLKAVEYTAGYEWAQYIEQELLEFNPTPVYGTNPENAPGSIKFVTNTISIFARKFFRPSIKKGYYAQSKKESKKAKKAQKAQAENGRLSTTY